MPHRLLPAFCGLIVLGLVPSAATAAAPAPGAGTLSNALDELSAPSLRTAARGAQDAALGLPASGPASLQRVDGRIVVTFEVTGDAHDRAKALKAAGAHVIGAYDDLHTISASVAAKDLEAASHVAGVRRVTEALTPEYNAACPQGDILSEGDGQLKAATARSANAVTGAGVKVGILSDSWDRDATDATSAAQDTAAGDLPGPASPCPNKIAPNVVDATDGAPIDEGRAMGQIVHDMAPDAQLLFRQGGPTDVDFAKHIRDLASAGAKVIVDDVTFFSEPMFQDGIIAKAVTDVTAQGASYFSSAANSNVRDPDGKDEGSYETAAFRPVTNAQGCPFNSSAVTCHDFNAGAGVQPYIQVESKGGTLRANVQWAEPQRGVKTDLDVTIVDNATDIIVSNPDLGQDANVSDTQKAAELGVAAETDQGGVYDIYVTRFTGMGGGTATTPRMKMIFGGGADVTNIVSPDVAGQTIFGHNGSAATQSVAAYNGDPGSPSTTLEDYSSRGPVTLYFGPVTGTNDPAAALPTPQVLSKPDVTATDCNKTTFFQQTEVTDVFRFCGTSAAAPHAAGVAALQLQRNQATPPDQIKNAQKTTAVAFGGFGATAIGAGLIDADAAVRAIAAPAPAPPPSPPSSPVVTVTPTVVPTVAPPPADTTPPKIKVKKRPKKKTTSRKATITFSKGDAAAIRCKLDKAKAKTCKSPVRLKKLKRGKHTFSITAVDAAGNPSTTKITWKVVKKK